MNTTTTTNGRFTQDAESPKTDWDVQANAHRAPEDTRVLKRGDTFVIIDRLGEMGLPHRCEQGLYHQGTRFLSNWELLVDGHRPLLLGSNMKKDNSLLIVEMTSPEINTGDVVMAQGNLHIFRSMLLDGGAFYEHLKLTNYSRLPVTLLVEYRYGNDFRDIFEIRGANRAKRGQLLSPKIDTDRVALGYRGLDEVNRSTIIEFEGDVESIDENRCIMRVRLDGGGHTTLHVKVACESDLPGAAKAKTHPAVNHAAAVEDIEKRLRQTEAERTEIFTSNEQFNSWLNRSNADLDMLISETDFGRYPYAGVPWFATPFGRDGLITALETLWLRPKLARGVLSFLAATQASDIDAVSEAEPGKIIHEMRDGEMAKLGEVPFRRYYGTVDATPLYVVLAGKYYRRTGDREFIEFIWPNIRRALRWIDEYGDVDGDGFVEYRSSKDGGLVHQCWKDSNDSVFHCDGLDAAGPIAASEVQGYVYEAKLLAAEMFEALGDEIRQDLRSPSHHSHDTHDEFCYGEQLRAEAVELKRKFNDTFWVDSIGTYAIALDGDKRPCAVRNSNAGHLLYSGIVDRCRADQVAEALTDDRSFSGWGIRTIAKGETRYNPMSYHNGSIWPHDTAIAAAGLSAYGYRDECDRVVTGLFNASLFNDLNRLPELFCGFDRISGHAPTLYPVACSPQAWAAGAAFLVLQSLLGLSFSPDEPEIRFTKPRLPDYLDWVKIQNLRIADASVDLVFHRHPSDVGMHIERKSGKVQVVVVA
tara:strand:+ start:145364 stop:147634 length:2271 start_codon:yes stop_codon:yes gene_type:complete